MPFGIKKGLVRNNADLQPPLLFRGISSALALGLLLSTYVEPYKSPEVVSDPRTSQSELAQRAKVPMGSIQIKPGEAGRLIVLVPYSPARVAKMKTIAGRRWHADGKYWTVPHTNGALANLLSLFAGEPVEIEPSLRPAQVPHLLAHVDAPVSGQPVPLHSGLLDQVRQAIRLKHYSHKTEEAYVGWIKRFITFHHERLPAEIAEKEIGQYLSTLVTHSRVSASTQNQALNAVLFLYHEVLGKQIGYVNGVVRAKRPQRLPVVLTRDEVKALLIQLDGPTWLMATLLYGAGLRLMECCRLRVKDLDFTRNQIVVRAGKGDKDRYTMLPVAAKEPLARHLEGVRQQHVHDLEQGLGHVPLPNALARKYPQASKEWGWQWIFPATRYYTDPATRVQYRHHLHESVIQKAVKEATRTRLPTASARTSLPLPTAAHT